MIPTNETSTKKRRNISINSWQTYPTTLSFSPVVSSIDGDASDMLFACIFLRYLDYFSTEIIFNNQMSSEK